MYSQCVPSRQENKDYHPRIWMRTSTNALRYVFIRLVVTGGPGGLDSLDGCDDGNAAVAVVILCASIVLVVGVSTAGCALSVADWLAIAAEVATAEPPVSTPAEAPAAPSAAPAPAPALAAALSWRALPTQSIIISRGNTKCFSTFTSSSSPVMCNDVGG